MDEKLEQVLHKVELLCEQNPEFATALRGKLKMEATIAAPVSAGVSDERVDKIEQYLGLDYKLDTITPDGTKYKNIDYSFITDDALREQLESDFREMMRFRYGTRSHKIDFKEFCKYAHFQLEALVNDYMEVWSLNENGEFEISRAKENIKTNWPANLEEPKFREKAESVNDIDYFQKKTAIINSLGIRDAISRLPSSSIFFPGKTIYLVNYLGETIDFIRKVRNDYSHRGIGEYEDIEKMIEDYENDKQHIVQDSTYGLQYEFNKFTKDTHYYMWCKRSEWDDVIRVISIMLDADKKLYKKHNLL